MIRSNVMTNPAFIYIEYYLLIWNLQSLKIKKVTSISYVKEIIWYKK